MPVIILQVGCIVTLAVAAGAGAGAVFTVKAVTAEIHPVVMSFTDTL